MTDRYRRWCPSPLLDRNPMGSQIWSYWSQLFSICFQEIKIPHKHLDLGSASSIQWDYYRAVISLFTKTSKLHLNKQTLHHTMYYLPKCRFLINSWLDGQQISKQRLVFSITEYPKFGGVVFFLTAFIHALVAIIITLFIKNVFMFLNVHSTTFM